MMQRFYSKPFILAVAAAGGVILTVMALMSLRQAWFSSVGTTGDTRALSGENNPVRDAHSEVAAEKNPRNPVQTVSSRPVVDNQRAGLAESPVQPLEDYEDPLEATVNSSTRPGQGLESGSPATTPIAEPKLVAGATTVRDTDRGPVATIQFSRINSQPISLVVVVAFLPPQSDSKILDLSPDDGTTYSSIDTRVSENGLFAAFQGKPQDMTDFLIHLSVTKPVTATIKGNCGIEPFEIDLRPE